MNGRTFLDTNVLVYAHDVSDPTKMGRARELLAAGGDFVVSTQVLVEMFNALSRGPAPILSREAAAEAVRIAAELPVIAVQRDLVLGALERQSRGSIGFLDALIVEAALYAGCTRLLSEDIASGGQIHGEIEVENPFAGLGAKRAPARAGKRRRRS